MGKGPNTSMPHSKNGGVLARRCEGRGAICCDMSGARNILHCTHDFIILSILRRPPSATNPNCLMAAVVCFRPVWKFWSCRYPRSASPVGVLGIKIGYLLPKVRSA